MGTVNVDGTNFVVYGTLTAADAFHKVSLDSAGKAFKAADDDTRASGLVNATRLLDRVPWQGEPVSTPVIDSVLQWPRSGVTDRNGNAVAEDAVPDAIEKACYVLAAMIVENPATMTEEQSGSNVKRVKADKVEVEFWTDTLGLSGRFAVQVQELVGQYLAGAGIGSLSGSVSYGTDGSVESTFSDDATFGLTRGT